MRAKERAAQTVTHLATTYWRSPLLLLLLSWSYLCLCECLSVHATLKKKSLSLSLSLTKKEECIKSYGWENHSLPPSLSPKPLLLPTSCNITGSKPQIVGTRHRGEKNTRQKKKKERGTCKMLESGRVSEQGDRRDRQGEKEGDDGCRRKVMARLETHTHTHIRTHTHSC